MNHNAKVIINTKLIKETTMINAIKVLKKESISLSYDMGLVGIIFLAPLALSKIATILLSIELDDIAEMSVQGLATVGVCSLGVSSLAVFILIVTCIIEKSTNKTEAYH